MDDSDDYFNGFDINAADLAFADQVESQYLPKPRPPTAQPKRPSPVPVPPPNKRQKTSHVPLKRVLSTDEYDLPEISLAGDNSYLVAPARPASTKALPPRADAPQPVVTRPIQAKPLNAPSAVRTPVVAGPSRQLARRQSGPVFVPNTPAQPPPHRSIQRRQSSQNVFGSQIAPRSSQGGGPEHVSRMEIEILRAQLNEAKNTQASLQHKLRAAEEAKFAKEGEVSILRATITKTAAQHASEVAKLQAAREAAEANKLRLMKESKEEIERIKTNHHFKQLEAETSMRRPLASTQKKQMRAIPSTPGILSSQMPMWSDGQFGSNAVTKTPSRAHFGGIQNLGSQRPKKVAHMHDDNKNVQARLGFQNGFDTSPSKDLTQKGKDKGKGKQRATLANDVDFFAEGARSSPPISFVQSQIDEPLEELAPIPSSAPSQPLDSPLAAKHRLIVYEDAEALLVDVAAGDPEVIRDEIAESQPPDWLAEIRHIIFTHSMPPQKSSTIQSLLNFPLLPNSSTENRKTYESACTQLLGYFGATHRSQLWDDRHWDGQRRDIATTLVKMARILCDTVSVLPLSTLFNLLRTLSYAIPSFSAGLISYAPHNELPHILHVLCDVVCTILRPSRVVVEGSDTLGREILAFVEALAFTLPEETAPKLSVVCSTPQVIPILFAKAQPTWLMARAARMLCVLASYPNMFRTLLPFPAPTHVNGKTFHKTVEELCGNLCDPSRKGGDADQLREYICTFVASLVMSHTDILATLLSSPPVVCNLVMYLSNETTPFWEQDPDIVESPAKISRVLGIASRTIALLYYMIFTLDQPLDLIQLLRRSGGLTPMLYTFIVTMGRFGGDDIPWWLGEEEKQQLIQITVMARELLAHVIEGPELDMTCMTFGTGHEDRVLEDQTDNDEEREAYLLHPHDD